MSIRPHVTLLLVEDDDLVRLTVAMMLEDLGFTVLEATTGEAALQRLKAGLDADILVTDIDLGPGISGLQLADQVREAWPRLPVVFVTGRVTTLHGRPSRKAEAYLSKPFSGEALARVVRSLLPA
jgi:CheY-like chemotaxis protein